MNAYTRYETKLASLMIGALEVVWAFLIISPNESMFYQTIMRYQLGEEWFVLMLSVGTLTCYGSLRPSRRARHIGLTLSVFLMLSMFGVFVVSAFLTPVTLAMPVFAIVCMLLLTKDAAWKKEQRDDEVG